MPINKQKHHRVYVTLTLDEYNEVLQRVSEAKKAGYKMTASSYMAIATRNQLATDKILMDAWKPA